MKADINDIREGVAEFAREAGISQAEAGVELLYVLAGAAVDLEAGMPMQEAIDKAAEAFAARWPKVFPE